MKTGLLFFLCSVPLLLASCSSQSGGIEEAQGLKTLAPLSCIAVLPAGTSVGAGETVDYDEAQSLTKGAAFATDILRQELQGNPKVRILSENQVATLVPEISGGISGTVALLGKKVQCDGVLLTTVRRYVQREGTEYSVDAPAAVDFSMVLRHSGAGNVLWSTDFREQQESFLDNILSFSKAKKRNFKWVTAEQLMEQGIKERLNECPYLE